MQSRRVSLEVFRLAAAIAAVSLVVLLSMAGAGAAGAVPDDWWTEVRRQIHDSEYQVTWQEPTLLPDLPAAWQAPNRAHGFRSYFVDRGVRVIPRIGPQPAWQWGLYLAGFGDEERVDRLPAGHSVTDRNQVTLFRGQCSEWFRNEPTGLTHGLTLTRLPDRLRETTPIVILFEVDGNLRPVIARDGSSVDFLSPDGAAVLRYGEISARDASGAAIPVIVRGHGEAGATGIRLVLDVDRARTPITVTGLATSPAWAYESDQANAGLGFAVATAGDVDDDWYSDVIVGALTYDNGLTDQGRAYLFHGSATGLSTTPGWIVDGRIAGARLGHAVATAGDVNADGFADVLVAELDLAHAIVRNFYGSSTGLSDTADVSIDLLDATSLISVAPAGDVNGDLVSDVIFGLPSELSGNGQALVYHGSASGLSLTADWAVIGTQFGAEFGKSVATAGDVGSDGYSDVIVGAPGHDSPGTDAGRAFVFHGSSSGLSVSADWTADGAVTGDRFGTSVSTAGDVDGDSYADVIVGAPGAATGAGMAYVFAGWATGLEDQADWTGMGSAAGHEYGISVSVAGDVNGDGFADVLIGARSYGDGQVDEGAAFVHHGSASGLPALPSWAFEPDSAGALLGHCVATAGDVNGDGYSDILVGAPGYADGQTGEGRAYVFLGSADGPSEGPGWTAVGGQSDSRFGYAVAGAGDVNGDGYADVLVGAPQYDNGLADEGQAWVYHGAAGGLQSDPAWVVAGGQADSRFGQALGGAGDVNGDGFGDVIVGAPQWDEPGRTDCGRATTYLGASAGLSTAAAWTATGAHADDRFGNCAAAAGDVNGDDLTDVVVCSPRWDAPQNNEGAVHVYHGTTDGLTTTAEWSMETDREYSGIGPAATAGDVNGDGYADLVIGSTGYEDSPDGEGTAWVYHGSSGGLALGGVRPVGRPYNADWQFESDQYLARLGASVGTAGDVNGDGFADVVVGAHQFNTPTSDAGRVWVFHGSAAGLGSSAAWFADGESAGDVFGISSDCAGDVNGDGFADVVVGASSYDAAGGDEGRAYVYLGAASGLSANATWTADGASGGDGFGRSVAGAGDVDGDGYSDVLVGAHLRDGAIVDEGGAFLFHGNAGPGVSLRPRQRRMDGTTPIADAGRSDSAEGFRLQTIGRSPFGFSWVRLMWEVKPHGTLFDETGLQTTGFYHGALISGANLDHDVTGLARETRYHWRARLDSYVSMSPFQRFGRWFTVPWNGWEETDLRTNAEADLEVTIVDSVDPVIYGNDVSYTITVTNGGPDTATGVQLIEALSPELTFVSATPDQGSCGEVGGIVTCSLGSIALDGAVDVSVVVTAAAAGDATSQAGVSANEDDPESSNDEATEHTTVVNPSIGDRVWEDIDADGIQDTGEPGVVAALVYLFDATGSFVDVTFTDGNGNYLFDDVTPGGYFLRFLPPPGHAITLCDQGGDDGLDSDADPASGDTAVFSPAGSIDGTRWDAGMVSTVPCTPPDEPVYVYEMTLTTDGNAYPVLHFMDPNQPDHITGYNVYRADDPELPHGSWTLVASDVIDMDEATPNKQWVDTSGDDPPGDIWYYQVAAYNHRCPTETAEGPW